MEKTCNGFRKIHDVIESAKRESISVSVSLSLTAIVAMMIVSYLSSVNTDFVTDSENEDIARYYLESLPIKLAQGETETTKLQESGKYKAGKKIAGLILGDDLVNRAESAILEVKKVHYKVRLFDYGKADGDTISLSSGTDVVDVKLSKEVSESKK